MSGIFLFPVIILKVSRPRSVFCASGQIYMHVPTTSVYLLVIRKDVDILFSCFCFICCCCMCTYVLECTYAHDGRASSRYCMEDSFPPFFYCWNGQSLNLVNGSSIVQHQLKELKKRRRKPRQLGLKIPDKKDARSDKYRTVCLRTLYAAILCRTLIACSDKKDWLPRCLQIQNYYCIFPLLNL